MMEGILLMRPTISLSIRLNYSLNKHVSVSCLQHMDHSALQKSSLTRFSHGIVLSHVFICFVIIDWKHLGNGISLS